jgi:hypothetical protein
MLAGACYFGFATPKSLFGNFPGQLGFGGQGNARVRGWTVSNASQDRGVDRVDRAD